MMHNYNTIFTLTQTSTGKHVYATEEYINFHGLEETPRRKRGEEEPRLKVSRHGHFSQQTKMKVYDVDGIRTIFPYGAYVWFDDETERDEHKAKMMIERAREAERNKVKNAVIAKLDKMSKADLEKLLEIL
jgi:hypothetical protein